MVRSKHECIFSLERQLAYQQELISKLFDRPEQDLSTSQSEITSGKSIHAPPHVTRNDTAKLSNKNSTNDENDTKEQKSPIVYEDIMETKQKGLSKNGKKNNKSKSKTKIQPKESKNDSNNNNEQNEKKIPIAIGKKIQPTTVQSFWVIRWLRIFKAGE